MYSNPALIRFRSALRSVGILRLIQTNPLYRLISSGYESRFDAAMMTCLEPGMRVFDIGANVGFYTQKFAEAVGPPGEVHAFERVAASLAKVRELQAQHPWIQVHQCAVGDKSGQVLMNTDDVSISLTHRVTFADENTDDGYAVRVATVDSLVAEFGLPSMIKIDVRGYEFNVLKGVSSAINSSQLKYVFVEIHFALLRARELLMAGRDISGLLSGVRFNLKFTDFSHLYASRD